MTIAELNALTEQDFVAATAPIFEGAPRFLGRLAAARPFASPDDLFERARSIARAMPEGDQIELVDAHPRLGAPAASVSAMSFVEQGYDRESPAPSLAEQLDRLNRAYEERFGFRYCVFVAGRPREQLVAGLQAALTADRGVELERAIDAVVDIARDRYVKLASPGALR